MKAGRDQGPPSGLTILRWGNTRTLSAAPAARPDPLMLNRRSLEFIAYFLRSFPGRTAAMVGVMILAGLAEGVGVLSLLPLLELVLGADAAESGGSPVAVAVARELTRLGLTPTLGTLLCLIVVAMSVKGLLLWLAMRQVGYTVARVAAELRLALLRALIAARWGFLSGRRSGHFVNAISFEAGETGWAYKDACAALASLIQVAVYLTVAMLVSWQMALIAIGVGGFVVFITQPFVRMSRDAGMGQVGTMKELTGRLAEYLPGLKAIKAMAREGEFRQLLERETAGFETAQRSKVRATETLRAFREPIFVLIVAVGLYLAIAVIAMPVATVTLLAVLFYRILVAVGDLQSRYQQMTVGESAFFSLREHTRAAREADESLAGGLDPPPLSESLRLKDVDVAYDGRVVLDGVDLELPARKFITLVGPSGSGKTTLVDLLTGLVRPTAGRVLIDGVPMEQLNLTAWRSQVGYVPQDPLLFHDTIERNVSLGRPGISRQRVRQALADADALSFIDALPQGLDRVIGERGAQLSGGQCQRIAIARALLCDPHLLILDEATTALDPETEAAICRTIRALADKLTVVSVSHQPAMQEAADLILRVEPGRVRLEPQTAPAMAVATA